MKKVIIIAALLCTVMVSQATAGNFSQTCKNISMKGARLTADCKTMNQQFKPAAINLDMAIGNLDGALSWGDRNFSHTCKHIRLKRASLNAICERKDGSQNRTALNLDERIDNRDGVLKFD